MTHTNRSPSCILATVVATNEIVLGLLGDRAGAQPQGHSRACSLGWLVLLATLLAFSCADDRERDKPNVIRRPNIVVIMTDDQRWDEVEYMPTVTQRLAGEGTTFTNSFVTTSLCCPSRASFLSGLYAHNHGIITLGGATRFNASSTVAVWLQSAGYRTALIGKYMNNNGLLAPRIPPGWDTWRTFADTLKSFRRDFLYYDYKLNEDGEVVFHGSEPADYSTDLLGTMAIEFIRANAPGPFFLVYTPFAPHAPPRPAQRHAGAFTDRELPTRDNYFESDVSDKPAHIRNHPGSDSWTQERARELTDQVRETRIPLLESLLAVDEVTANILDTLAELSIDDNTVVFFTSDNGFMWGEHWKIGKLYAYEESIRVPLIVRDPRSDQPRTEAALVLNIDLAPTIAELAGLEAPKNVDGRSFAHLIEGNQRERGERGWREDFLIELPIDPRQERDAFAAVRSSRWKYIMNNDRFEELYELDADPFELDNLLFTDPTDSIVVQAVKHMRMRVNELVRFRGGAAETSPRTPGD